MEHLQQAKLSPQSLESSEPIYRYLVIVSSIYLAPKIMIGHRFRLLDFHNRAKAAFSIPITISQTVRLSRYITRASSSTLISMDSSVTKLSAAIKSPTTTLFTVAPAVSASSR